MRLVISDRGAALVTVLLFVVLVFILITTMLTITGNEIVISGLHRDGIRALELAQAGVQEAVRRMEEGRPYAKGFTSSLDPRVTVTVTRRFVGVDSGYYEIESTATVGRATRRVGHMVLQQMNSFPPNVVSADVVSQTGNAKIIGGDVYSQTYVEYKTPPGADSYTYAGWRVSDEKTACYNPPCAQSKEWYPGQRRAAAENSVVGRAILTWATTAEESCTPSAERVLDDFDYKDEDRFATAPYAEKKVKEVKDGNEPLYGFDTDDGLATTPQTPCGFPYRWVREEFSVPAPGPGDEKETRWFKTIVFERWLARYYGFDEAMMTFVKGPDYEPQYGVVPPFPEFTTVTGNYDCRVTGGGIINSLPLLCSEPDGSTFVSDMGCWDREMRCSAPESRPIAVWLDGKSWKINATIQGHGTIVADGDLELAGDLEYWGTIIVNGRLTFGGGNVRIHGGLVVKNAMELSGNIALQGGGTVGNAPVGRSNIIGKAWWER